MPTKQLPDDASIQSINITNHHPSAAPTNPIMVMGSPGVVVGNTPLNASANASAAPSGGSVLSAVEELVYEIKENLRLKARPAPPAAHHSSRTARPSPYHIPCRSSWTDSTSSCDTHHQLNARHHPHQQQQQHLSHHHRLATRSKAGAPTSTASLTGDEDDDPASMDDPYEMLQTLLKSNNLVKEAVRRLQMNYDAIGGGAANEDTISPSKHDRMYFYDSDDEAGVRSPVMRMCELEL